MHLTVYIVYIFVTAFIYMRRNYVNISLTLTMNEKFSEKIPASSSVDAALGSLVNSDRELYSDVLF